MNKSNCLMRHSGFVAVISCCMITTLAGAQDLDLSAQQPSVKGIVSDGSEQRTKPSHVVNAATDTYIVRLQASPVATYEGGIDGLAATANTVTGATRLDASSPNSRSYAAYLERSQTEFIKDCEAALGHTIEVRHKYQHVLNGVTMVLTAEEASMVAQADGVVQGRGNRHRGPR